MTLNSPTVPQLPDQYTNLTRLPLRRFHIELSSKSATIQTKRTLFLSRFVPGITTMLANSYRTRGVPLGDYYFFTPSLTALKRVLAVR
jgi:hypothetical protein